MAINPTGTSGAPSSPIQYQPAKPHCCIVECFARILSCVTKALQALVNCLCCKSNKTPASAPTPTPQSGATSGASSSSSSSSSATTLAPASAPVLSTSQLMNSLLPISTPVPTPTPQPST